MAATDVHSGKAKALTSRQLHENRLPHVPWQGRNYSTTQVLRHAATQRVGERDLVSGELKVTEGLAVWSRE